MGQFRKMSVSDPREPVVREKSYEWKAINEYILCGFLKKRTVLHD